MTALPSALEREPPSRRAEASKLLAFLRRDFLEALSYRTAFITDAVNMALQALLFFFIGKLVNPAVLPEFDGARVSYFEFVIVGIAISMTVGVGMFRAAAAFRQEQVQGTLEVLLMTPTAPATIQLGSVVYDVMYVPLRTGLFFTAVALSGHVDINAGGVLPALVTLLAFVPFVWGLGILYAGWTLTFKVTGGGILLTVLTLTSGAYFPLQLLPDWIGVLADVNPMSLVTETMREALLGDGGWSDVGSALLVLVPAGLLTLLAGIAGFRAAVLRERRRGSLGTY